MRLSQETRGCPECPRGLAPTTCIEKDEAFILTSDVVRTERAKDGKRNVRLTM